jgi:hypothetical protein
VTEVPLVNTEIVVGIEDTVNSPTVVGEPLIYLTTLTFLA